MCKTFIVVYLIFHLAYPTLRKESFGVIQIIFSFTNFKMVNTRIIFKVFWIYLCAFTLALFSQFLPFFFLRIGSPLSMMLASLTLMSNLTDLPCFFLPPERASLYVCVHCTAQFLEYYFSTLHFSEDFPGTFNKHVFIHWSSSRLEKLIFVLRFL